MDPPFSDDHGLPPPPPVPPIFRRQTTIEMDRFRLQLTHLYSAFDLNRNDRLSIQEFHQLVRCIFAVRNKRRDPLAAVDPGLSGCSVATAEIARTLTPDASGEVPLDSFLELTELYPSPLDIHGLSNIILLYPEDVVRFGVWLGVANDVAAVQPAAPLAPPAPSAAAADVGAGAGAGVGAGADGAATSFAERERVEYLDRPAEGREQWVRACITRVHRDAGVPYYTIQFIRSYCRTVNAFVDPTKACACGRPLNEHWEPIEKGTESARLRKEQLVDGWCGPTGDGPLRFVVYDDAGAVAAEFAQGDRVDYLDKPAEGRQHWTRAVVIRVDHDAAGEPLYTIQFIRTFCRIVNAFVDPAAACACGRSLDEHWEPIEKSTVGERLRERK